ncbi:DNA cytosine methyltransferase [Aerococcaceae bacterium zg-B36]|uniref:DNA cytosine methyltransferase n=1 Tax=Aerococcaceae bacterium zg-252 TaxID=2796928 RepID=UPI001BD85A4C|nr:DNA cytosine methyltransferase [Aerococcaceae bacterium zg-B36]
MEIKQIGQYDTKTRKNSNRFRVYDTENLSPTINTMQGGGLEPHIKVVAYTPSSYESEKRIYSEDGISPTIAARDYKGPKKVAIRKEIFIGASRGRNPINPSDRTTGAPTQQRLEINKQGVSNTLTSVQKDNYVVEISKKTDEVVGLIGSTQKNAGVTDGSYSTTLTSAMGSGGGHVPMIQLKTKGLEVDKPTIIDDIYKNRPARLYKKYSPTLRGNCGSLKINLPNKQEDSVTTPITRELNRDEKHEKPLDIEKLSGQDNNLYRVRKLTPKECWRLMGISDEDFHKAEAVNSNSQLYKQAGNAIVVNVLEAIFGAMFKRGVQYGNS